MNFHSMDEFSSQCRVFITAMTFTNMIHIPGNGELHKNGEFSSNGGCSSKLWLFIKIMTFHQYDESLLQWRNYSEKFPSFCWVGIKIMKFHYSDESFITMMNFYHYFEFNYRAKFPPKSVLVPIEAELGLAQPQLVKQYQQTKQFTKPTTEPKIRLK